MTTHRKTIMLSGWIATAVIILLATITPSVDSFGSTNNVLIFTDTVHAVLFSGLTMAGLHAARHIQGLTWTATFIGACVWFGARLLTILVSLLSPTSITVMFFIIASGGAVVAFLIGIMTGTFARPDQARDPAGVPHDLMRFRILWVCILLGTGIVILVTHLASYAVDGMTFNFSLIVQTLVRQIGPQIILAIMLLAIPLHIRLAHKVVLIPMALLVLFEALPMFTGFIGLSLNMSSEIAPWLASRTGWLSTISWIIAVIAIMVVYSRTDARLQASDRDADAMVPRSHQH